MIYLFSRPPHPVRVLILAGILFVSPGLISGFLGGDGISGAALHAQQNPFISTSPAGAHSEDEGPVQGDRQAGLKQQSPPEKAPGPLMSFITTLQRELYSRIAEAMGKIKSSEGDLRFLFMLLLGSGVYGMLHALGPGHRKMVIFSYFLAEDAKLLRGIGAGMAMAILHGAAAAGLILPLYYLVRGSLLLTFNSVSRYIELGTFLFITLFGTVMFLLHLFPLLKKDEPPADEETGSARRPHGLLLLIIGSGFVPCPGAAMILIFALSLDMVLTGLLAVAAMSLGMAITLSLVAVVSLGARGSLERGTRRYRKTATVVHIVLELGGYGLIAFFGLVMLLGMV